MRPEASPVALRGAADSVLGSGSWAGCLVQDFLCGFQAKKRFIVAQAARKVNRIRGARVRKIPERMHAALADRRLCCARRLRKAVSFSLVSWRDESRLAFKSLSVARWSEVCEALEDD